MTTVVSVCASETSPKRSRRASTEYAVAPGSSDAEDVSFATGEGEPSRKRKRSASCSTNSSSLSTKRHHKKKKKKMKHRDREHSGPRVNPIFVWVKQDNTKIVEVLCEDYDRRNRITLTKTAGGWRSIPHSDRLSRRCSSLIRKRSQSFETDFDERPCSDADPPSDAENCHKATPAEVNTIEQTPEKEPEGQESPRMDKKSHGLDIYDFHEDSDDDAPAEKPIEEESEHAPCCHMDSGITDENHNNEFHEPIHVSDMKDKASPNVRSSPSPTREVDSQSQADTELVDLIDELHDDHNMVHDIENIKPSSPDGQSLKEISLGVCKEVLKDVEKDDEFSSDSVPFIDNNACSDLIEELGDLCHEMIDERLNDNSRQPVTCGDFGDYMDNANDVYENRDGKLHLCNNVNTLSNIPCSQSNNISKSIEANKSINLDIHHDNLLPSSLLMDHTNIPCSQTNNISKNIEVNKSINLDIHHESLLPSNLLIDHPNIPCSQSNNISKNIDSSKSISLDIHPENVSTLSLLMERSIIPCSQSNNISKNIESNKSLNLDIHSDNLLPSSILERIPCSQSNNIGKSIQANKSINLDIHPENLLQTSLMERIPCSQSNNISLERIPCSQSNNISLERLPCSQSNNISLERIPCSQSNNISLERIPCSQSNNISLERIPCSQSNNISLERIPCSQSSNTSKSIETNKSMSLDIHPDNLLPSSHSLLMDHSHQEPDNSNKRSDIVSIQCLHEQGEHGPNEYQQRNQNYNAPNHSMVSDKVSNIQPTLDRQSCPSEVKHSELRDFHNNSPEGSFDSSLNEYLLGEEKDGHDNQDNPDSSSFIHHEMFYEEPHIDNKLPNLHLSKEKVDALLQTSNQFSDKSVQKQAFVNQTLSDKSVIDVTKEKKSSKASQSFETTGSPINLVVNKSITDTMKKEKISSLEHLTDISVTTIPQSESSKMHKSNSITLTESHNMTTEDRKRYLDKVLNITHSDERPPRQSQASVQKEPLNLGKVKKEKSPSPVVVVSKSNPVKSEGRVKSKIEHSDSACLSIIPELKNRETKKEIKENTKLMELLSPEGKDPLAQLKEVLSDPNFVVPDPLLVPRGRLAALVANPAKEIPRLLVHSQHESDLVVVSISHLQTMLQTCSPAATKPPVFTPPNVPYHHNKTPLPQTSVPSKMPSMDPSHMLWLPYLGQLEAALAYGATTQEFLSTLSAVGQYPPGAYKTAQKNSNFMSTPLSSDQHHMFNIWQDIMQKPDMSFGWKGTPSKGYLPSYNRHMGNKHNVTAKAPMKSQYTGSAGSSARTTPNLAGYRSGRAIPEVPSRVPEPPRPHQPAKLKVKDHLVDPNVRPQLLKLDDSPQTLWHPLFSR